MQTITNLSKITPPRVPGVLHRPRLTEQINKNQDKRLLFILGQAAQGKSTLAASYAGTQEIPVAWLNLDEGDSDPVNLFYWLINALQHCLPERDLSFLKSYPAMSRSPREPTLLYREWVQVMFEQINGPVQLVLDGLDRLHRNAPSFLFLQTLTHEAPPHLRLILLSREEPPFGLQELKMKQQAHILTNEDLAFTLFEKAGDLRGCLVSLATLIGTQTLLGGLEPVPMSVLLTKGEDLLSTIGHDLYPLERVSLWMNINSGFCFFNPRKAYQASQNAYLIARTTKAPLMMQIFALIRSFGALLFVQEISLADEISKEIEKLLKKQPFPEMEVEYHFSQGILFSFKGDLEKAEAEYKSFQTVCERLGLNYLYTILIHEYINLKTNLGQHREAEELGQRFLSLAVPQGQFRTAGNILFYLGINSYFEGDYDKAKEYLQRSREFLPANNYSLIWLIHRTEVFRGFLWRPGEPEEPILKCLHTSLDYFSSISAGLAIEAHFALALIYWQKKDPKITAQNIHLGFETARGKGLAYFQYTSPNDIARICALAIELGDQEDSDYALKILTTRRPPQAEAELERLMTHSDPKIQARAAKIGFALHRSTLPRLKIETLGGFKVMRSGSPLKEEEWHGSNTKNMLKAIVAQGEEGVRKEVLMESLWPEGKPAKVEKTFKFVLHRLRQVLEPDMDPRYGYSYVRLKENRVSLDRGICEVDVDKFLALLKEGEKREASQQIDETLSAFQEAIGLYQGDFLPDDVYSEWAGSRREELRWKYLSLLFKTARIHEDRGTPRKAVSFYKKAVEIDPFSEEAHRRLMVLFAGMGKHDEALNIYKSYQKALRERLDAEPETLIKSIYKKIENQ
jgi:DNA-binding SARP family transcriptional activator